VPPLNLILDSYFSTAVFDYLEFLSVPSFILSLIIYKINVLFINSVNRYILSFNLFYEQNREMLKNIAHKLIKN